MTSEASINQRLVLAVDDNPDALYALERILVHGGYQVETAASGAEALNKAREFRPSIILLDIMMPQLNGYEVVKTLKADSELRFTPVILVSAKDALNDIVKGLDGGADDYITKPFRPEELLARMRATLRLKGIYEQLRRSEENRSELIRELKGRYDFSRIIGKSAAMRGVFALLEKIVDSSLPVLITGPSGTGKELVAKAIHFNSKRSTQRFMAQNCAAFSETLLESELFGHARGAFTGAFKDKKGLFEAADGGTLFLDEVGEMSGTLQAKLLRVLQEGVFIPVGSTVERRVDVRVLAATNRNLEEMVEAGRFREDLYYRLNVLNVCLPTLAERREDIALLVEHFLAKAAEERKEPKKKVSAEALELLIRHEWRGNVRELQNEVERMLVLGRDAAELGTGELSPNVLKGYIPQGRGSTSALAASPGEGSLKSELARVECALIREALARSGWNKSNAAKELGISRSNLIAKVQQYGLEEEA